MIRPSPSRAGISDGSTERTSCVDREPIAPTRLDDSDSSVDLSAVGTRTNLAETIGLYPAGANSQNLELRPGVRLGQYRLLRELGAGGMAIVYEAEDEWLSRRVALKVLRPNLPEEQEARERFLREARAMASVEHENVCTIYQVGDTAGRPFMAMQLLVGESLETRLDRERRLPTPEAARIGREIAAGLAAAHARGLVHRDVKPANVWLEAGTGRVKLLDFGLALARDYPRLTHPGYVIGTPAFMSPEQARGELLDGRSDLFNLGIVLYLATTGEPPFGGATPMAMIRNLEMHVPGRVNVKRADVPPAFSNLIMELLAKERKDRPASAEAVAIRLARPEMIRLSHLPVAPSAAQNGAPLPAVPDSSAWEPSPYARPAGSPIMRVLFLAAVAAIGIGFYWYVNVWNYGKLVIESQAIEPEIVVRQNGQSRQTITQARELDLRPGNYELSLSRPKSGYKLTQSTVRIGRGGRETVGVVPDRSAK